MTTASQPPFPPVRRSVTVKWGQAAAFRRFTEEISTWWPTRTHSVGEGRTERVVFEGRVGGEIHEIIRGGERAVWGRSA